MPTVGRWTYLIADLRTNIILGELPCQDVRFSITLNGSGAIQALIPTGDPRFAGLNLYDMTRPAQIGRAHV